MNDWDIGTMVDDLFPDAMSYKELVTMVNNLMRSMNVTQELITDNKKDFNYCELMEFLDEKG